MTAPYPCTGLGAYSPKVNSYSIARKQISQYGSGHVGLHVVDRLSKPTDVTDLALVIYLDTDFDETNAPEGENQLGTEVGRYTTAQITREDVGTYSVEIDQKVTKDRGNLTAAWTYKVGDQAIAYTDYLQITEPMPYYDSLREYEKDTIQRVSWLFADGFDSTNGGPNLTENFQTHFNFERMAQLMERAVYKINTHGAPLMNYGLGEGTTRIPREFEGLLTTALYLEVLKHFMRAYTEQPVFTAMNVTYTDRRDYVQRWQMIYQMEKDDFDKALSFAKRKLLSLGRGALLVSGGIYGGSAGYFRSGTYAAQVRAMRFYPVSSTIVVAR